jgi:hypothetical protein
MMRHPLPVEWLVVLLAAVLFAQSGRAQEVYISTDDQGVASFTDFPVPGAQVVVLETIPADPEQALTSQEMIDQQLAVAKSLEESRLAREKAYTERLEALAAGRPQTYYYPVERDITYWGVPGYGYWPGNPGRPPWRPGYRPPGLRPPHHRPPGPSQPIEPGPPPSQSRPMPPQR